MEKIQDLRTRKEKYWVMYWVVKNVMHKYNRLKIQTPLWLISTFVSKSTGAFALSIPTKSGRIRMEHRWGQNVG